MRPGLPTSVVLHVALIAWIVVGLPWKRPLDEAVVVDAMPIEFVPVADVAALRLGQKTAKPKEEITPKETKQAAKESEGTRAGTDAREEPPPPPPEGKPLPKPEPKPEPIKLPEPKPEPPKPEPVKAPEPKPEPPKPEPIKMPEPRPDLPKEAEKAKDLGEGKPPIPKEPPKDTKALDKILEEQKKLDEKKAADAKAAAEAKARAEAKAAADKAAKAAAEKAAAEKAAAEAKAKSQFNSAAISDILNKKATGSAASPTQQTASLGAPSGRNAAVKMTQREIDAFVSQVRKCWNPPPGVSEVKIQVTVRVTLNQDGTVGARPQVVEGSTHPMGPAFANSAVRAILQCGPYQLPAEKYATWRDFDAVFTPELL